jgi:hypothetical protein
VSIADVQRTLCDEPGTSLTCIGRICSRWGLLAEIIEHGVTSCIVRQLEEAVRAVAHLQTASGRRCRQLFDTRLRAVHGAQESPS